MPTELRKNYDKSLKPAIQKALEIENVNAVPRVTKVVVSIGMGESILDSAAMTKATEDLATITGQQPQVTRARKSISNFKLREGMKIGLKVTLRRDRMYAFLEKLFSVSLPRVRDFKGLSRKAFDGKGNYNLGIREQIIFPEINYDNIDKLRGMQITIVTTAENDKDAYELLKQLGMPFKD